MTLDKSSPKSVTIWRFIDGKPGHEKQSLGLVLALAKLQNVNCHEIKIGGSAFKNLLDYCFGRSKSSIDLPIPDLLVGAGHRTHLPMLAAKWAYGGKSIVLMKPSLPYFLFDLCLVPEHDNPPERANIIPTIGALNPLGLDGHVKKIPSSHLILIGGPSPHYLWDNNLIIDQVEQIVKKRQKSIQQWVLTTSPRTPKEFIEKLRERKLYDLKVHHFKDTKPGWVEEMLLASENAWVTPDSVSMTYEALSAGCRTGVFEIPKSKFNSRISKSLKILCENRYIFTHSHFIRSKITTTRMFTPQANACAFQILKELHVPVVI
ncbi:mitochondrial fission ELM1 family protein [Opitutales bacterium]|nr:mitochondrial fission ELM1 family protein [Opitutales bacterium]